MRQNRGVALAEEISRQKLELICGSALFTAVDEIVVEQIISDQRCQCQRFFKGELVYDKYQFPQCLGIVLEGQIRVEKSIRKGKRMRMSVLQPGACFGAATVFQEKKQYAMVLAAECETEVLFFPKEVLRWAMQRNYTVTENYIRYLSDEICFLHEKISNLTAGIAEQRLALFLAERCDLDGTIYTSMVDLCKQLNFGRATLYRAMDALEARGLIKKGSKSISIIDRAELRKMIRDE